LARSVRLRIAEFKPDHPLCKHRRRLQAQVQSISMPERLNLPPRKFCLVDVTNDLAGRHVGHENLDLLRPPSPIDGVQQQPLALVVQRADLGFAPLTIVSFGLLDCADGAPVTTRRCGGVAT